MIWGRKLFIDHTMMFKREGWAGDMAQFAEYLPSVYKAPGSAPSII